MKEGIGDLNGHYTILAFERTLFSQKLHTSEEGMLIRLTICNFTYVGKVKTKSCEESEN